MPRCNRCKKYGLFLKLDDRGHCDQCAETVRIMERDARDQRAIEEYKKELAAEKNAEAERRRREEQAALNEEIERQRRARQEAERIAELKRPFAAPDLIDGFSLAYSYPEVGFYVPDECRPSAVAVPPGKQLRMELDPTNPYDPDAVAICYGSARIGYMNKGRLRDMLMDFARDDEKDFLAVSRYWDDRPAFDLFFYRAAEDLIPGSDDDDDDSWEDEP